MMMRRTEFRYDAATGLSLGARETQEDAVLCDIPSGSNAGLVVLADGLGGHAAGAIASQLAVSTALSVLAGKRDPKDGFQGDVPDLLVEAAQAANAAILRHATEHPETRGMGTTLVILALLPTGIHWLSIGDSPLYLMRDGLPVQLNETHSLAAQLDLLVRAGELPAAAAAQHPDRHCLTSALGEPNITLIDCPQTPFPLANDDILVLASDGILSLSQDRIHALCTAEPSRNARDLSTLLLHSVAALGRTDQDNLSVAVIRPLQRRRRSTRPFIAALESRLAATGSTVRAGLRHGVSPMTRARRAK